MGRDQIEIDVSLAITAASRRKLKDPEKMTFDLVPSKPLDDGGLGLSQTGYDGFLSSLFSVDLPDIPPYKGYVYPRSLVSKTRHKPLSVLLDTLTELLFAVPQPYQANLRHKTPRHLYPMLLKARRLRASR